MTPRSKYLSGHALLATLVYGERRAKSDTKSDGAPSPATLRSIAVEAAPRTLRDGLFHEPA